MLNVLVDRGHYVGGVSFMFTDGPKPEAKLRPNLNEAKRWTLSEAPTPTCYWYLWKYGRLKKTKWVSFYSFPFWDPEPPHNQGDRCILLDLFLFMHVVR